jgi:Icc-related predicted phosphoesterase
VLGKIRKLSKPPDICFIAGDITNFGSYKDLNKVLEIITKEFKETFFILGNCDPFFELENISTNAFYVESNPYKLDSFTIIGFGDYRPNIDYKRLRKLEKKGEKVCLLTHAPPHGTKADLVSLDRHGGSREVKTIIEKFENIFLIVSGHIHESPTISELNHCTIINPGPITRGSYAIITIKEDFRIDGHLHNIHEK